MPNTSQSLYQRLHQRRKFVQNYTAQTTTQLAQYVCLANHIYNTTEKWGTIDSLLRGRLHETWRKAVSNEFGRLTRENRHGVSFTDTLEFIFRDEFPEGRDITYVSFWFDYRPLKEENIGLGWLSEGTV